MTKLGTVRTKDVIAVLEHLGFEQVRTEGSHRWYRHPATGKGLPVKEMRGKPYHDESLGRMLHQIGITKKQFAEILREVT